MAQIQFSLIKKNKDNGDWTSRTLANLTPPTSANISFLPYPLPPSAKWTSYVYHPVVQGSGGPELINHSNGKVLTLRSKTSNIPISLVLKVWTLFITASNYLSSNKAIIGNEDVK